MADLLLNSPAFPADTNLFYKALLENLPGLRSLYMKDKTTVGLKTTPITITGTAPPGAIVRVFHSTFGQPDAFLMEVAADP